MDEHSSKNVGTEDFTRRLEGEGPSILVVVGSAFMVGAGAAFVLTQANSETGSLEAGVAAGLLLLVGALAGYLVLVPRRRPRSLTEDVPVSEVPLTARASDLDAEFFGILAASSLGGAWTDHGVPEHDDRTEAS